MNKVLKKMTIVYKEGVYCIFHIDEQFMTILQLLYIEGILFTLSQIYDIKTYSERKANILYFKNACQNIMALFVILHVISVYLVCFFIKRRKSESKKILMLAILINVLVFVASIISTMSFFPFECIIVMLFSCLLLPIFLVIAFVGVPYFVKETTSEKDLAEKYSSNVLKFILKEKSIIALKVVVIVIYFLVSIIFFKVSIIIKAIITLVFILICPIISGMAKRGYNILYIMIETTRYIS